MIAIKWSNLKPTLLELRQNIASSLTHSFSEDGCWEGKLSDSALSTATGIFALAQADQLLYREQIALGVRWLKDYQNTDGGWGDTPSSKSNLSTTLLCWSTLSFLAGFDYECADTLVKAETWITDEIGDLKPVTIKRAVVSYYGNDLTFSAPILTMCTLAGRMGPAPECWREVPGLPFELAVLPHRLFKWLQLNVVSYALPALIAVGWVRHHHQQSFSPVGWLRQLLKKRIMLILEKLQPENGGFLEATPLTAFVVMCLCGADLRDHPVVRKGVQFLTDSMRQNGSWPIDTNLSLWVTTLAVKAFCEDLSQELLPESFQGIIHRRLLSSQFMTVHPFTKSSPGGWAWTHLTGAVPDADDAAGALLALNALAPSDIESHKAAEQGVNWLLRLQNSDGGIPTFCKGWGRLPFDKSCPDITAHALRSFIAWRPVMKPALRGRMDRAIRWALHYLAAVQRHDGAWIPLWFGNQEEEGHLNPTYGTAQVMMALTSLCPKEYPVVEQMRVKGERWLRSAQNRDGGWGGDLGVTASVEETSLALCALSGIHDAYDSIAKGIDWLVKNTDSGRKMEPRPIGLYFASLWYEEELYPWVFSLTAINRLLSID